MIYDKTKIYLCRGWHGEIHCPDPHEMFTTLSPQCTLSSYHISKIIPYGKNERKNFIHHKVLSQQTK